MQTLRPLLLVERVFGAKSIPDPPPVKPTSQRPPPTTTTKPPFKVPFSVTLPSYPPRRPSLASKSATLPKKQPVAPFLVPLNLKRPPPASTVKATPKPPASRKPHFFSPPTVVISKADTGAKRSRASLPTPRQASSSRSRSSLPATASTRHIPRLKLDKTQLATPILSPASSNEFSPLCSPTTPCPTLSATHKKEMTLTSRKKPLTARIAPPATPRPKTLETCEKSPATLSKKSLPSTPKSASAAARTQEESPSSSTKSLPSPKTASATLSVVETSLQESLTMLKSPLPEPQEEPSAVVPPSPKRSPLALTPKNTPVEPKEESPAAVPSPPKSSLLTPKTTSEGTAVEPPSSKKSVRRVRFEEKENKSELLEVFRRRSLGNPVQKSSLTSTDSYETVQTAFGTRKVRKVVVPPLEDGALGSRDPRIQSELCALRSQRKVQGSGEKVGRKSI